MRRFFRSPYLWTIVAVVTLVTYAYVERERFREAAVLAGATAPDFSFPSLTRGEISLSDYEGEVVLVNVWATWCDPCREEMPSLQRLRDAFEGADFEVLAVSIDAAPGMLDDNGAPGGDLAAFAREYGLTFPILHDRTGSMRQLYQVTAVPETFVVGRNGIIFKKLASATEWDLPVNQALVRRLLDR